MKKVILVFLTVACSLPALCQTDTPRQQLNTLFGNLNAAQVPSGYLAPYGTATLTANVTNACFPSQPFTKTYATAALPARIIVSQARTDHVIIQQMIIIFLLP